MYMYIQPLSQIFGHKLFAYGSQLHKLCPSNYVDLSAFAVEDNYMYDAKG